MKRNDFLQNLLLIILSAALAAGIVDLACLGAIPVTYTSRAQVQLTGDDLHVSDIKEFAGYIEGDDSLKTKVMDIYSGEDAGDSFGIDYRAASTAWPDTGIVDIFVRSDDPYTAHDLALAMVKAAYSDYPASHEGISVNLLEAPSVADEPDPRPVFRYTILGAIFGAAFGALLSFFAVKSEREKRRRGRKVDERFAKIEEPDEQVYDALFADDNEDVDPEMRELYKVTKRAGANREQPADRVEEDREDMTSLKEDDRKERNDREKDDREEMNGTEKDGQEERMSEEAEAAYLEAMEIEATAAGDEDSTGHEPAPIEETEGGDPYEE